MAFLPFRELTRPAMSERRRVVLVCCHGFWVLFYMKCSFDSGLGGGGGRGFGLWVWVFLRAWDLGLFRLSARVEG